jgi:hypothetical protein
LIRTLAALLLLLPLVGAAQGQQPRDRAADIIDFGADKNKLEVEAPPPAAPQAGNLIRYDIGRPTSMTYYIDAASVSLMRDGVIRFTSVAKGEGGGQNVAYEGMRCDTREYKTFAHGKADGTWSVLKEPQWRVLRSLNADGYRFALYQDYFCPARESVASAAEAVDALRRGGHTKAVDFNWNAPVPRR